MNTTKLEIRKLTAWDSLFRHYPQQTAQQGCYLELDCKTGVLHATYNSEIGNAIPFSVYHGHDRRYGVPCLTAAAANELLNEIAPLAQRVLDGYAARWNGNNIVADLTDDATAAEEAIEAAVANLSVDESNTVSGWCADVWLTDAPNDLAAETTNDEIETMANSLDAEAAGEHIVLMGTVQHLTEQRQEMRDALAD